MAIATMSMIHDENTMASDETTMSKIRFLTLATGEYCGRLIVMMLMPWMLRSCVACWAMSSADVINAISRLSDSICTANVLRLSEKRSSTSVTITVCAPVCAMRTARWSPYSMASIGSPQDSRTIVSSTSVFGSASIKPVSRFTRIGHTRTGL